jgi:hypothetical protein
MVWLRPAIPFIAKERVAECIDNRRDPLFFPKEARDRAKGKALLALRRAGGDVDPVLSSKRWVPVVTGTRSQTLRRRKRKTALGGTGAHLRLGGRLCQRLPLCASHDTPSQPPGGTELTNEGSSCQSAPGSEGP